MLEPTAPLVQVTAIDSMPATAATFVGTPGAMLGVASGDSTQPVPRRGSTASGWRPGRAARPWRPWRPLAVDRPATAEPVGGADLVGCADPVAGWDLPDRGDPPVFTTSRR